MITKVTKVYWCEFCVGRKRKKSFRRHVIARHETICFANPNRTPQPGEVTQEWQAGSYSREDGEFIPHQTMPAWWPGIGMIYTGAKWVPVPGTEAGDWPSFDGQEIFRIKPWIRRLQVLGIDYEHMPEDVAKVCRQYNEEQGMRDAGIW